MEVAFAGTALPNEEIFKNFSVPLSDGPLVGGGIITENDLSLMIVITAIDRSRYTGRNNPTFSQLSPGFYF